MKGIIRRFLYSPKVAGRISKILVRIHHGAYMCLGTFASAAEGGLHPKHRLINYHQFFINHTSVGETILDVGCGNGALLRDIVAKTNAAAVGVELLEENIREAKKRLAEFPNVVIVRSDIWEYKGIGHFDAIVLSNVLEHVERRTELLRHLIKAFKPKKILLRVPMFEREWLVPYKKELGIEWRLDSSHQIEYTEEEFRSELAESGLDIRKIIFKWGEIYAVASPTAHLSRQETE